jgi:hypothetical protein
MTICEITFASLSSSTSSLPTTTSCEYSISKTYGRRPNNSKASCYENKQLGVNSYSNTLQCPNDDDGGLDDGNKIYIEWCDTPWGLMKVCECPICHQKYRFHGVLQERWNLERFLVNLYYDIKLRNKLENKKQL